MTTPRIDVIGKAIVAPGAPTYAHLATALADTAPVPRDIDRFDAGAYSCTKAFHTADVEWNRARGDEAVLALLDAFRHKYRIDFECDVDAVNRSTGFLLACC